MLLQFHIEYIENISLRGVARKMKRGFDFFEGVAKVVYEQSIKNSFEISHLTTRGIVNLR